MISTTGQSRCKSHSVVYRLQDRELCTSNVATAPNIWTSSLTDHYLEHAKTFNYYDLLGHFGCVNAAEFSPDGQYLVSGGDDKRILLWKVWDAILEPEYQAFEMKRQHSSNIFCLSFDNEQTRIYSGGNDECVMVHNLETGDMIEYLGHPDDVYSISVDPNNNNIFVSASCEVNIWDIRSAKSSRLAMGNGNYHSVMYNPVQCNLLVTASDHEGLDLYDIRQTRQRLFRFFPPNVLHGYSFMCARFNQTGTKLLSLSRKAPPVLYDIRSPYPQVQFDADGFFNACTLKNCTFAGNNDQFVASGSDNFFVYMWKIPDFVLDNANTRNPLKQNSIHVVNEPVQILSGNRSIVNHCRFSNKNGIILSTGIEKMVRLWSPIISFRKDNTIDSREPKFSRDLFSYTDYLHLHTTGLERQSTAEDPRLIAYFDSMIDRDMALSTGSSSSEEIFSYFHHLTENLKSNNPVISKPLDPCSEVTVSSDSDEMFAVQKRFDFNSFTKENSEGFGLQDHLDLVFAKRIHARYLNAVLSNMIHQIKAESERLRNLINLSNPNEKDHDSYSRPLHNIFALLKKDKRELVHYEDLDYDIKLKKQYKLLFKSSRMVNSIFYHMRNETLFSKRKDLCCVSIVNYALFKTYFSSTSNTETSIKNQSTFYLKERRVIDKKLCSVLRNLCKKALYLLELLIDLNAQPLPIDQLNVRYSDSDLNSLLSEGGSSSSLEDDLMNTPMRHFRNDNVIDLEDENEDEEDENDSIPPIDEVDHKKNKPEENTESSDSSYDLSSSTLSENDDIVEEMPLPEEAPLDESKQAAGSSSLDSSVTGPSTSTAIPSNGEPSGTSTADGTQCTIKFKKSDFIKRNSKTRRQYRKRRKHCKNKRQRKS